jgi:hypothetical protein
MKPRLFSTLRCLQHENPLVCYMYLIRFGNEDANVQKGLPRTGSIPRMQRGLPERRRIKDVKKVIAVSSAKGGVGKSTIAGSHLLQVYGGYSKLGSEPSAGVRPPRPSNRHSRHRYLRSLHPYSLKSLGRAAAISKFANPPLLAIMPNT